jgi:hypothetical protein
MGAAAIGFAWPGIVSWRGVLLQPSLKQFRKE